MDLHEPPPGYYRVAVTWQPYSNRVINTPYTILDGTTPLATVLVNQQQAPVSFLADAQAWQELGGPYALAGTTLVVRLSDLATPAGYYLVADAVRVERIGN